ncbi:unnamed protein product [Calypogeia fissa]
MYVTTRSFGSGAWVQRLALQPHVNPFQDELLHLHHLPSGASRASSSGLLGQPFCVCGHPLDPVGTHILRCSHGSERTATHDNLCDVLAAITWDTVYHVSTEQTHVLPAVDGIPDRRRVDIVFSQVGVWALVDVVVADPMGASMVSSATHIPGHAASHAAWLKEEAYAIRHHGDLFYPFVVEVFWALHLALDRFLWFSAALCIERRPYPLVLVVTAFLRQQVSVTLQGAQAFTIQWRAEAVRFRASRHVPLLVPTLTFTTYLYQVFQFRVE